MDGFGKTSVLGVREPSVYAGFAQTADFRDLGLSNAPLGIEGMRCHPELTTTIKLKQFDLSSS